MRKSLWIISLLFTAIVAPNAHGDTYSISFGGAPALTAPAIQWNGGLLPAIFVTIAGDTQSPSFTLLGTAGGPTSLSGIFPGCSICGFQLQPASGSTIRLVEIGPLNVVNLYATSAALDPFQIGLIAGNDYSVKFIDTPEPGTAVLLLVAMMLLVVTRKWLGRIQRQRLPF